VPTTKQACLLYLGRAITDATRATYVGEDGLEPPASCTSGRRSPPELHALNVLLTCMFHVSCFMFHVLCPRKVLTLRPLPCDGSALPLSYRGPCVVRPVFAVSARTGPVSLSSQRPGVPAAGAGATPPAGAPGGPRTPTAPYVGHQVLNLARLPLPPRTLASFGGDDRLRTGGLCGASAALCQLSYIPVGWCRPGALPGYAERSPVGRPWPPQDQTSNSTPRRAP
jgi:hypothetical protein